MCYVCCGVFASHYTDRAKAALANIKLGFYPKTFCPYRSPLQAPQTVAGACLRHGSIGKTLPKPQKPISGPVTGKHKPCRVPIRERRRHAEPLTIFQTFLLPRWNNGTRRITAQESVKRKRHKYTQGKDEQRRRSGTADRFFFIGTKRAEAERPRPLFAIGLYKRPLCCPP